MLPATAKIAAASRADYATAAATALLQDDVESRTYELGGPEFSLPQLARTVSEVTGTKMTYRDLPTAEYAAALQRTGLDEAIARFVAALDASIARGDLETKSQDLARLLERPVTSLSEVVRTAYDLFKVRSRTAVIGFIGAGMIGGAVARLAIDAGYNVVLSHSRGPETLSDLVNELGPAPALRRQPRRPPPGTSSSSRSAQSLRAGSSGTARPEGRDRHYKLRSRPRREHRRSRRPHHHHFGARASATARRTRRQSPQHHDVRALGHLAPTAGLPRTVAPCRSPAMTTQRRRR